MHKMSNASDSEKLLPNSLVLYKKRPARVVRSGERLEIELEGGNLAKVRPKDFLLLHPGPLQSLGQLQPQEGEVELTWQILGESPEEPHSLEELAELIYGQYTPATAWAAWQQVEEGLYFRGSPEAITACSPEEIARKQAARQAHVAEALAWAAFVERVRRGCISAPTDAHFLREVEDMALGRKKESRLLRELGRSERPESAHALLLELGYWSYRVDPYPTRLGLPATSPEAPLPPLADEPRIDLTGIPAFAIDDRENQDPDDAISLVSCQYGEGGDFQGGRIWIHVADVAALVPPNSKIDVEARSRGATLYLPEGAIPMLPLEAVQSLGLGLHEVSPALSFGLELNASGEIISLDIQPSLVKVQRMTYELAEERLEEEPLRSLYRMCQNYMARRQANGALFIDLPEVILRVTEGQIDIRPVRRSRSRDLVREAMLMTGEAAARFAIEKGIPFPFATQEAPAPSTLPKTGIKETASPDDLASHFAVRRLLRRSQVSCLPSPHAGIGLSAYTRATSPLRRYLDLAAHQQLRASLRGQPLFTEQEMLERVGNSESVTRLVTQAEALARRHWTLVYLMQHPEWQGEGILVEKDGLRGAVIIPELALETPVHLRQDLPLNSTISLRLNGLNLAELEVHFIH